MARLSFFISFAFILVLSDAVINYFLENLYHRLPVLGIAPIFLFLYIAFNKHELRKITRQALFYIYIGVIGYSIGLVSIENAPSNRFFEIITAYSAWLIGFLWVIKVENENSDKWNTILLITLTHSLICLAALTKIAPHYFPIKTSLWALNREVHERPELTTDPNFQVFYFLPVLGILIFYKNFIQAFFALISVILAAYAISAIQSRSGLLVFGGVIFSGLFLHIICKGGQKSRAILILTILGFVTASVFAYKYDAIRLILIRFTEENYQTGYGRLHGLLYLFEKIWNPLWWIPHGSAEYKSIVGVIPHSNITAHFLDGGILGIFSWLGLIVTPTIKLFILQIRSQLNRSSAIVSVLCLGALVAQLSINAPFMDLLWLYGGMAVGSLHNLQSQKT